MKLGLSKEALIARRKFIGGSDAVKIMAGDWFSLWEDKTGRKEPEDLSRVLPVQMGNATEEFNAYWFELMTGNTVVRRGEHVVSKAYPFMACTLDGVVAKGPMVWQAKHVAGRQPLEEVVARYTPQVTHEMLVCGLSAAVLSVLIGTDRYEAIEIPLDDFYAETLIEREREFWGFVERDEQPLNGAPIVPPPPVEKYRKIDMTGNNQFASLAADWLANEQGNKVFLASIAGIKAMIEPDVGEATGYGLLVKRDRRGISIKRRAT